MIELEFSVLLPLIKVHSLDDKIVATIYEGVIKGAEPGWDAGWRVTFNDRAAHYDFLFAGQAETFAVDAVLKISNGH